MAQFYGYVFRTKATGDCYNKVSAQHRKMWSKFCTRH